jgi:hypothetical protein
LVCHYYFFFFKNIFVDNDFISPFHHTNNANEVILYTTALLCFPKNLIPWWDSNPGLLVPEADAMSTAPRRQGFIFFLFVSRTFAAGGVMPRWPATEPGFGVEA